MPDARATRRTATSIAARIAAPPPRKARARAAIADTPAARRRPTCDRAAAPRRIAAIRVARRRARRRTKEERSFRDGAIRRDSTIRGRGAVPRDLGGDRFEERRRFDRLLDEAD